MASAGIGRSVEGTHAVLAALRAGRVRSLQVERSRRKGLAELLAEAERNRVEVRFVEDVRDHAETSAPQGVVATCQPIEPLSLKDLVAHAPEPASLLVLDHLEDPHNVGAIARSAWAAGMHGVVVARARSAPLSGAAFKAAAGALEHLAIAEVGSTADAVKRLSDAGVWTVGLSAAGDADLFGLELLTQPVAIVIGAEGTGLARLVEERCDVRAAIPMANPFESLNASVAAALAAFEVLRARR
ncbi:MAG: 23S rRNA (guanosine(2251)-2'-O)-methyltransferase RlmB [Acidimicrobiia bacterium]|nr:23S rRNA (guanosine(2251)-2'-O)-methyltransferase RlmB [Acidimicrobiia bacterium]